MAPISARRCLREERNKPLEVWPSCWDFRVVPVGVTRAAYPSQCLSSSPRSIRCMSEGGIGDLGVSLVDARRVPPSARRPSAGSPEAAGRAGPGTT